MYYFWIVLGRYPDGEQPGKLMKYQFVGLIYLRGSIIELELPVVHPYPVPEKIYFQN